jgi:transcriptional regulator with XRE-family HTH domain
MNFGRAIREVRAARNLTQKMLAASTGLDPSYISLLESNKRQPSTETLVIFARALKIPFYLLALLASDGEDLRDNISRPEAKHLADQLLGLVLAAEK